MIEVLKLGAHLKVKRTGYTHHGIYVGNGNVVHYSGFFEMFKKGKVELTSIDEFMGGEEDLYRVKYPAQGKVYSDDEICERALSRLNENNYNLVTNNCEHFATWCVTGVERSEQVEHVKKMTTTVIVSTNVIKAIHMLYVSTTVSTPIIVAGGGTLPTIVGGSTIAAKAALTTTAVTSATIATTAATGTATGGAVASALTGATLGAAAGGAVAVVGTSTVATTTVIGAVGFVGGTVGTVVAAPVLVPIAAGAAIGAGAVALWSWLKD